MVPGHWLLLLFLSHDLRYIIHAVGASAASWGTEGNQVRWRRSNRFFGFESTNGSFMDDRMLEDEAEGGRDLQEKLVVRGQVVILECLEVDMSRKRKVKLKDTHPDAAAKWYHDDKEAKPDLRVSWSVEGRLRISHAVSGDSGVWKCRKEGNYRRPLRLIVTIPPEPSFLVYGGAQLAQGARLTTRAGNALSLHCVVEGGNPAPTIAWFLNEREITSNSTVRNEWRGPDKQFASVSNVTIERVLKSHHNASVVCRVVHPALSRPYTSHLKLNIEYPPDFRLRRWPVWGSPLRQGASVSLLCNVDSNPPSLPFWVRGKEALKSGGEEVEVGSSEGWLNFTGVSIANRGWYKCATNHAFGHFSSHSVFINVLPPLKPSAGSEDSARVGASRLGGATPSDHVILPNSRPPTPKDPCTSASGSSSLCLHTSNDDETERPKSQQFPLRQREGASNCPPYSEDIDDNNRFIWRSDIKIKVMNRTHAALEGGPAMLTAHVCGADIVADQVTWFPPSKKIPLTPGKPFGRWTPFNLSSMDSQRCVLSNLHIVPVVSSKDEGAWVILVLNSLSAHAAVIQLNVSTAAKSLAAADIKASEATAGVQPNHSPTGFSLLLLGLLWLLFACGKRQFL